MNGTHRLDSLSGPPELMRLIKASQTFSVCVHFHSLRHARKQKGQSEDTHVYCVVSGVWTFSKSSLQNKAASLTSWPLPCASHQPEPSTGWGLARGSPRNIWKTLTSAKWMGGSRCMVSLKSFCHHGTLTKMRSGWFHTEHILHINVTFMKQSLRHCSLKMNDTLLHLALLFVYDSVMVSSACVTCHTFSSLCVIT